MGFRQSGEIYNLFKQGDFRGYRVLNKDVYIDW